MVPPISIHPKFFACVTDTDVLSKVSISDRFDGGWCVQHDLIWVYYVSFWHIVCHLCHGESHMQWLWLHGSVICRWWKIYCIVHHLLAEVSHDIRKLSPIMYWDCLAAALIITLEKCHNPNWCMCLELWRQVFVTAQYVIDRGRFLSNFQYPGEHCFSSHYISLSILHNCLKWGGTLSETS